MSQNTRLSTGVDGLDELLGGGLVPGTLAVVVGATGVGKTQLGLHFAQAGREQEGRRGILFDMTARGDSQNHAEYARRLFDWQLDAVGQFRRAMYVAKHRGSPATDRIIPFRIDERGIRLEEG